jgi:hypothetical protein
VWRALLLPETSANINTRFLVPGMEGWIREQLLKNAPYDEMVKELLTIPVGAQRMPTPRLQLGGNNPLAFYQAKEFKPENISASVARLFLGVRLECAQCHNHPFADWKRDQFWSFTAFFAGIQAQGPNNVLAPGREIADRREITIPGTERMVQATFPDGSEPQWKTNVSPRVTLAEWLTAADNPYFARAAVNRMWAYFFGVGLIDPVDEMVGADNVASHPELLDLLAKDFTAHKFDTKYLMKALTLSKAYQLSSARGVGDTEETRFYQRMPVRGLTPEQLYESIVQATGYREPPGNQNARVDFINNNSPRTEFLNKFSNVTDKSTEFQTSILQALTLINGRLVAEATSLDRSETLAAVLDSPFMTTTDRLETLYLATLSRKPTQKELDRAIKFVDGRANDNDKNMALADVFWMLLNSGEFILNH